MFYSKWIKIATTFIFIVAHGLAEHHEPHAETQAHAEVCERKYYTKPRK